jgi:hypothetical protein
LNEHRQNVLFVVGDMMLPDRPDTEHMALPASCFSRDRWAPARSSRAQHPAPLQCGKHLSSYLSSLAALGCTATGPTPMWLSKIMKKNGTIKERNNEKLLKKID